MFEPVGKNRGAHPEEAEGDADENRQHRHRQAHLRAGKNGAVDRRSAKGKKAAHAEQDGIAEEQKGAQQGGDPRCFFAAADQHERRCTGLRAEEHAATDPLQVPAASGEDM